MIALFFRLLSIYWMFQAFRRGPIPGLLYLLGRRLLGGRLR